MSPEIREVVELLCSAHEIARRGGTNTNWQAFLVSVKKALAPFNRNWLTARTYQTPCLGDSPEVLSVGQLVLRLDEYADKHHDGEDGDCTEACPACRASEALNEVGSLLRDRLRDIDTLLHKEKP